MTMTHSEKKKPNISQKPGPTDMSDGVMTQSKRICYIGIFVRYRSFFTLWLQNLSTIPFQDERQQLWFQLFYQKC